MDNNQNDTNQQNDKETIILGENVSSLVINIVADPLKKISLNIDSVVNKSVDTENVDEIGKNWDLDSLDKNFLTFDRNLSSEVTLYRCITPVKIGRKSDLS